jgi:NMD protein affecting ribosome stability and mRNA decay
MNAFESNTENHESPNYRLCPRCTRTVHASSYEHYCINDGSRMLEACPVCGTQITSPYARYCAACGFKMTGLEMTGLEMTGLEMTGLEMMGLGIVHQH